MAATTDGQVILEEELDSDYEPSDDEVLEYAKWLGMDQNTDRDMFWLAREGLMARIPDVWKPCRDSNDGAVYYYNFRTGESQWDHPCDRYYKSLFIKLKEGQEADFLAMERTIAQWDPKKETTQSFEVQDK